MGKTLEQIAQEIYNSPKKVQLIYAFNGVGKTRLSRTFKELVSPIGEQEDGEKKLNVIYYNAFTEDLFYWDNDLDEDTNRKLIIRPNNFTKWILEEEGQAPNIVSLFQSYTNDKLTPRFGPNYEEIEFSIDKGDERIDNIKISKGEESCLVWCIFFSLLKEVAEVLKEPELENRTTHQFDELKYVFIDDPVSSLDENHLIELAVNVAQLITESNKSGTGLKFVITTHNPLFYNVLYNELKNYKYCSRCCLEKLQDGTYELKGQDNDSPFSYHNFLLNELKKAKETGDIKKYHYNFLRQILEKTSTFLGYEKWKDLLPKEEAREAYYNRIINISSHGKQSGEEVSFLTDNDKNVLSYLVDNLIDTYHFKLEQTPMEEQQ